MEWIRCIGTLWARLNWNVYESCKHHYNSISSQGWMSIWRIRWNTTSFPRDISQATRTVLIKSFFFFLLRTKPRKLRIHTSFCSRIHSLDACGRALVEGIGSVGTLLVRIRFGQGEKHVQRKRSWMVFLRRTYFRRRRCWIIHWFLVRLSWINWILLISMTMI